MIERNTPECAVGLTDETLSVWRDGGFHGDKELRIRQHTATCAACRQRLDGFATVARALGRQRELEPGDRVWRGVRDRLASRMRGSGGFLRPSARTWRGVVAAASVILVVGLLGYVLNTLRTQRGMTAPTITPTLTSSVIIPGPQLAWRKMRLPPELTPEVLLGNAGLAIPAVAPSDGNVAYTCAPPAQGETNAHLYFTRDRGQTWTRGGDIPVGARPDRTTGYTPSTAIVLLIRRVLTR